MTTPSLEQRAAELTTAILQIGQRYPAMMGEEQMIDYIDETSAAIESAIRAAVEEAGPRWIPVGERLPEDQQVVLAAYKNSLGNWRRVRAVYTIGGTMPVSLEACGDFGEYDEEQDEYFCPAGWYEENEMQDTSWMLDETVTHWMPLPQPPTEEK